MLIYVQCLNNVTLNIMDLNTIIHNIKQAIVFLIVAHKI